VYRNRKAVAEHISTIYSWDLCEFFRTVSFGKTSLSYLPGSFYKSASVTMNNLLTWMKNSILIFPVEDCEPREINLKWLCIRWTTWIRDTSSCEFDPCKSLLCTMQMWMCVQMIFRPFFSFIDLGKDELDCKSTNLITYQVKSYICV